MDLLKTLFLISLLLGCTRYSELKKNKDGDFFFKTSDIHLKKIKVFPWKVGIKEKETLSKGIGLIITYPRLEKKDIIILKEKYGIDSWVVRVRRRSTLGSRILGHFYTPIFQPGRFGPKNLRARQILSAEVLVFYSAAAISDRIQRFPCPVLNHRKKIEGWDLSLAPTDEITVTLTPGIGVPLETFLDPFSYAPQMINGGLSLVGKYSLEIAAFDFGSKRLISDWIEVPEQFKIEKESEAILPECTNWEPPIQHPDYRDWKRFKWKKDNYHR
ncbi:MAG: hypothetical protein DRQ88_06505 [Epsilonproteobacteria bacterium]|nr:MAG: hypothetical protein DRQ89_04785 [Campylobacterota bacterium]RLA66448.1 MAG: hypothetical protein DRQ88_06505 [Campylobacterota bacterium]